MTSENTGPNDANEPFVGVDVDQGGSWDIYVAGGVKDIRAATTRLLDLYAAFLDANTEFFRAVEVTHPVLYYSENVPTVTRFDMDGDIRPVDVEHRTHTDPEGISGDDLQAAISSIRAATDEYTVYVPAIEFDRVQTPVVLDGFDGWLDRTDEQRVRYYHKYEVTGPSKDDPFHLLLKHSWPLRQLGGRHDSTYWLKITCNSELWFEETELGRQNHRRLERVFERLWAHIDPIYVSLTGWTITEETMLDLLPDLGDTPYQYEYGS